MEKVELQERKQIGGPGIGSLGGIDYRKASARSLRGEGTVLYLDCGWGCMAVCIYLTALP